MRFREKHLKIGNSSIFYQVGGIGEPVVLLHGLAGSTRWWQHNQFELARHFQVYVVDLVGFGRSHIRVKSPQPRFEFTMAHSLTVLVDWLNQLIAKGQRVHLVGHSMGGLVAAQLALQHPERVDKLVLVDAAAMPFQTGLLRQSWDLTRGITQLPINFLPVLIGDAWRAGPKTMWQGVQALRSADISAELVNIQAPVLLIWGEKDTIVPLAAGKQLAQLLPHARLFIIKGAGHNAMWEQPATFNRLVVDFLRAEN